MCISRTIGKHFLFSCLLNYLPISVSVMLLTLIAISNQGADIIFSQGLLTSKVYHQTRESHVCLSPCLPSGCFSSGAQKWPISSKQSAYTEITCDIYVFCHLLSFPSTRDLYMWVRVVPLILCLTKLPGWTLRLILWQFPHITLAGRCHVITWSKSPVWGRVACHKEFYENV